MKWVEWLSCMGFSVLLCCASSPSSTQPHIIKIEKEKDAAVTSEPGLTWVTCHVPSLDEKKKIDCAPMIKKLSGLKNKDKLDALLQSFNTIEKTNISDKDLARPPPSRAFFTVQKPEDAPDLHFNPTVRLFQKDLPDKDDVYFATYESIDNSPLNYLPAFYFQSYTEGSLCPWTQRHFDESLQHIISCHRLTISSGMLQRVDWVTGLGGLCGYSDQSEEDLPVIKPVYKENQELLAVAVWGCHQNLGSGILRPHFDKKGRIEILSNHSLEHYGILSGHECHDEITPLWYRFVYDEQDRLKSVLAGTKNPILKAKKPPKAAFSSYYKAVSEVDFMEFQYDSESNFSRFKINFLEELEFEDDDGMTPIWLDGLAEIYPLSGGPAWMVRKNDDGSEAFAQWDIVSAVFKNSFIRLYLPSSRSVEAGSCLSKLEKGSVKECLILGPMLYDYLTWKDEEIRESILRPGAMAVVLTREGVLEFVVEKGRQWFSADMDISSPFKKFNTIQVERLSYDDDMKIAKVEACTPDGSEGYVSAESRHEPALCRNVTMTLQFMPRFCPLPGTCIMKIGLDPKTGQPTEVLFHEPGDPEGALIRKFNLTYKDDGTLEQYRIYNEQETLVLNQSCFDFTDVDVYEELARMAGPAEGWCFEQGTLAHVAMPYETLDEWEHFKIAGVKSPDVLCLGDDFAVLRYEFDEQFNLTSITPYNWDCTPTVLKNARLLEQLSYYSMGNGVTPINKITFDCEKGGIHINGRCLQGKISVKKEKGAKCKNLKKLVMKKYATLAEKGSTEAKLAAIRGLYEYDLADEAVSKILENLLADPSRKVQCEAAKEMMEAKLWSPKISDLILKTDKDGQYCDDRILLTYLIRMKPDIPEEARALIEHLKKDVNLHSKLENYGLFDYFK